MEATSRNDWWNRWGKHYLPSLIAAHTLQLCHNFKDPGVQSYGGSLFRSLRDAAEKNFLQLPPPVPSSSSSPAIAYPVGQSSSVSSLGRVRMASAQPVINMSSFYNAQGGCFVGDALVSLAPTSSSSPPSFMRASELRKGAKIEAFRRNASKTGA